MYVFMVSGISLLMFIIHYVYTTTVRKVSFIIIILIDYDKRSCEFYRAVAPLESL